MANFPAGSSLSYYPKVLPPPFGKLGEEALAMEILDMLSSKDSASPES